MPPPQSRPPEDTRDRAIVTTRVFDAPRELVWEAMTDPKHFVHWWGPRGFTSSVEVMDVRPGGVTKLVMRGPDGTLYPNQHVYVEVVKPERIVYQHGGHRENGPSVTSLSTWTFEAVAPAQTRVTIQMVFPTAAERDFVAKEFKAVEGAKQTLARLAEHLPEMRPSPEAFVLTRVLAAPRELVWAAWTEGKHLQRWFGPKGFTMPECSVDLRPGGVFHYGMRTPDGHMMWGKWTFVEIVPPEKLVVIVSFSDAQGGVTRHPMSPQWPLETLSTMTLTESPDSPGETTLSLRWAPYKSTDEERQTFEGGKPSMNQGWAGTFEQLTAYLKEQTGRSTAQGG